MPIPTITYRVDAREPNTHQFQVTLTVPAPSTEQRLSLPVWIPGSYLVREFARHLSALEATQGGRVIASGDGPYVLIRQEADAISIATRSRAPTAVLRALRKP